MLSTLGFASATSNYIISSTPNVDFERFGHAIAASTDYLVVGTYTPSDNAIAHQFIRSNANSSETYEPFFWQESDPLTPIGPPFGSNQDAFSFYGSSVALLEESLPGLDFIRRTVVVGSPYGGEMKEGQVLFADSYLFIT